MKLDLLASTLSTPEIIKYFQYIQALGTILSGSLVTTAWRIFRLQMEKTASRYGG
jgi:hypothetical protein